MSHLSKKMTDKVNNQVIRRNKDTPYQRAVLETHTSCCKDHILPSGTVLFQVRLATGTALMIPEVMMVQGSLHHRGQRLGQVHNDNDVKKVDQNYAKPNTYKD